MDERSIIQLGLGSLAVIAVVTVYFSVDWIEEDLTERTVAELAASNVDWAHVTFSGRDATLLGAAPGDTERAQAHDAVAAVSGVRVVHDETTP